ncbi:L-tyrosine/L-tryptophan isonitrile synthase family protein [Streptomyces cinnamoneus]|uniref:Paerucumarin biosynthesis protein PvcA n=1 Tax=Streptomyces cinnamoneus TaxID=53446 RepID=A0A918U0H9_STRCJ|nr:isocyanide synthase family protein [Streptomyces cinnamoneus]GHC71158.1 paerucumarin biosynthesis protein PvcA [Streptomyces cinnamoneus]
MSDSDVTRVARGVMELVLRHQRKGQRTGTCALTPCPDCRDAHVARVERYVAAGEPVRFVLPAFPGKSPNTAKVLGFLPDKAEQLALEFLSGLTADIREVYAPGAEILICSDGRVFSDAVGIPDEHITAYQREMQALIDALPRPSGIGLFNLEDLPELAGLGHDRMREILSERYAEPLEQLRKRVRAGEEAPLYRAITRFLFEDGNTPEYTGSRAALQRDARARAYVVIQRSKAWGDLLADRFPGALRLSIHPQPCGAEKLGIHLVRTPDNWLTPWHSVALDTGDGDYVLVKRSEAEARGAQLVRAGGRPSHYALTEPLAPATAAA